MKDDTISRQAAIDAVMDEFKRVPTTAIRAKNRLEGLPAAQPEIVHCKDCIYFDPPHVENGGRRYEYTDMPPEAFTDLGTGDVVLEYGINVGGRCCRDYNIGYKEDKRVFVPETNYCGRAVRITT